MELTSIWIDNNSRTFTLNTGTVLWHAGRIPEQKDIKNHKLLFTTRNEGHKDHYVGNAKAHEEESGCPPAKIELTIQRNLYAADFNCASLGEFQSRHFINHGGLKAALREWCIENGFEAIVRINRGEHEVAIVYPATDLKITKAEML